MQQSRGVEYLEDTEEAAKLQLEELHALKLQRINALREKQDGLLAFEYSEREQGRTIKNFQKDYDVLTRAIEDEKNKPLEKYAQELKLNFKKPQSTLIPGGGSAGIMQILGNGRKQEFKGLQRAQALRSFTDQEMKKINDHHGKLEPNLQKLMDAAISDDQFSFEFIASPVFVRGDGNVYDRKVLEEYLAKNKGKAMCPQNQAITFTQDDLVPCNTLIRATEQLLYIIETEGKVAPVREKIKYTTLEQKAVRQRVPEKLIPIIEAFYEKMPDKHKVLFDIVCRDPVGGFIMDDPVLLPDGHVYDRTIAMYLLKKENSVCRLNPAIRFTEKDITPCHFVVKVLMQLKENIEEAMKLRQQQAAQKPVAADNGISPEQPVQFHFDRESLLQRKQEILQQMDKLQKELLVVEGQLTKFPVNNNVRMKQ